MQPVVDSGRRPVRAVTGETFQVSATVFREGHEMLGAGVVLRAPDGSRQEPVVMRELAEGSDRYGGDVIRSTGMWQFHVEAWGDPIARWQHDAAIKVPLGQDVELMLADGAAAFERAASHQGAPRHPRRPGQSGCPRGGGPAGRSSGWPGPGSPGSARGAGRQAAGRADPVARSPRRGDQRRSRRDPGRFPLRELLTRPAGSRSSCTGNARSTAPGTSTSPRSEGARVDRPAGTVASGTLRTAARRLDAVARMGFDVVYLPPVHPIGYTARKGPNNSLNAAPGDPGSPWAIGSAEGGHDAVHPDLGTIDGFDAFVRRAGELGMEVALDFALQCSADHPWVAKHRSGSPRGRTAASPRRESAQEVPGHHPAQLRQRPGGDLRRDAADPPVLDGHGVRIFRVDNPHTKPLPFWERLLAEVAATDPDVIFLAEAFTRPAMMAGLAIMGFHRVVHVLHRRNSADELTDYLRELSGPAAAYMRPNFFVNTPDILSEYLQYGGNCRVPRAPCSPRCSRRPGGSIRATSSARTLPPFPAARSTWTRRSTSTGRVTGTTPRPWPRISLRSSPTST